MYVAGYAANGAVKSNRIVCPSGTATLPGKSSPVSSSCTFTVAIPLCPSLVAAAVVFPAATAVTRPLISTVAIKGLRVAQVTARPDKTFPAESRSVAVNGPVWPTMRSRLSGVTLTVATGTSVTVTDAVPLLPSLVAVIVAVPTPVAVTRPVPSTVATPGASLPHVMARPDSGFPAESRSVAVSCPVRPSLRSRWPGATPTVTTGTSVTVTDAVPLLPSLVAVIVAVPTPTALTRPVPSTVAAAGATLPQATAC